MAPNARARSNHDELFPGHVSTLAVTDPELIETFDNFAFDEVLRHSRLDVRTRLMVQLAAMIACQAVSEYRVMLGAALTVGVSPVEVKEIVYQAVPYVGMAKVFDFIHATNDVLAERGVALPLPGQATTTAQTRAEKGLEVQKKIIGSDAVERLHATALADQQHIRHFLAANCFGDHLTRTGLDLPTRELAHAQHAGRARRLRRPGQGPCRRQPPCRQRPRAADRCRHPAAAVHRLSAHPQRAACRQGSCRGLGLARHGTTSGTKP